MLGSWDTNPGGGTLGSSPIEYIHSSAKYYLSGENWAYIVTDAEEIG
jgi:hypothetical protein